MTALACIAALGAVTGCATNSNVVNHAFGFDTRKDAQDAVVLEYRYGDSKLPVRSPISAASEGRTFAFENVHGPMLKGDFLYVKWRSTTTGQVHEDTIDLRSRLPADLTDHTVYFMIHGAQLYVYLISPENVAPVPDISANGPRAYRNRKITMIYPDPRKP